MSGVVYIGHLVVEADREEVVEAVPTVCGSESVMALFVIGWLAITLLFALAGYAIGTKLRDRP